MKKILIVDDQLEVRELVQVTLEIGELERLLLVWSKCSHCERSALCDTGFYKRY